MPSCEFYSAEPERPRMFQTRRPKAKAKVKVYNNYPKTSIQMFSYTSEISPERAATVVADRAANWMESYAGHINIISVATDNVQLSYSYTSIITVTYQY